MSSLSATLSVRTEKNLKKRVGEILQKLGLNHSTAINIYYHMILSTQGIPFELKVPNKTTLKALEESKHPKKLKSYKTPEALFSDLEND